MAAYYNFGLKFFAPEEWVVKIDGDQIYLSERLKEFLQPEGKMDANKLYGLTGYNTFVRSNELVFLKKGKINGGSDSFVVKRKNIKGFRQENFYEKIEIDVPYQESSGPVWFHFMKTLKTGGVIQKNEDVSFENIQYTTPEEKYLFDLYVRPLLVHSPYYKVKIPVNE